MLLGENVLEHSVVTDIEVIRVAEQGQSSEVSLLNLTYDAKEDGVPETLFLKFGMPMEDRSWNVAHEKRAIVTDTVETITRRRPFTIEGFAADYVPHFLSVD